MLYEKSTIKSIYKKTNSYQKDGQTQSYDVNILQLEETSISGKVLLNEYQISNKLLEENQNILEKLKTYIGKEVLLPVYVITDTYKRRDGSSGFNVKKYVAGLPLDKFSDYKG